MTNDARPRAGLIAASLLALAGCSRSDVGMPEQPRIGITQLTEKLGASKPQSEAPLSVAAELINPLSAEPSVRFKLTNITQQPISIDEFSLPWRLDVSVQMTGILPSGRILPIGPAIDTGIEDDSPPRVLAPGESISEDRTLAAYFALAYRPRDSEVLLLWTYRQKEYVYSGLLVLPH